MVTQKQVLEAIDLSQDIDIYKDEEKKQIVIPEASTKNDYEFARANLYEILNNGNDALEKLIKIASTAESARAFEVVAILIEKLTNSNKELLNLAEKKKDLEKEDLHSNEDNGSNHTTMTTADLLKQIKDVDYEEQQ